MLFLTPVWGEPYVRLYLNVVIPAQLSAKNLPVFASESGVKYIIYTTQADADTIRAAPIFRKLNATIPVAFSPIDERVTGTHDRMSDCFRRGVEIGNNADSAIVFLTPDIVFADGSFATLKRLAAQGCDAVFVPSIRTLKQGVSAALLRGVGSNGTIQIAPRQLMRVALDNLHPLADLSWWNEGDTDLLPANLYWRIGSEGILARCFHLHPIYVRPQRKHIKFFGTVDDDFCSAACPDESKDHVICDSDDFLAIELSDPSHFFHTSFRKGSVEDAVAWAEQFANARHRSLFTFTIRMHTGIRNPELWQQAAGNAERIAASIRERLTTPTWRFLFPPSPLLVRRVLRRAEDGRLEIANRDWSSNTVRPGRLNDYLKHWAVWVVPAYRAATRTIRKMRAFISGPDVSPHFHTRRFLVQHLIRKDLLDLIDPANALIIGDDVARSMLSAVLQAEGKPVSTAALATHDGRNQYVTLETGDVVPSASCDFVLLELCDPREIARHLAAAQRVLSIDGRLLIFANRFPLTKRAAHDQAMEAGTIKAALRANYTIVAHRKQGGMGSVLRLKFGDDLQVIARRWPILFRLFELVPVWVPIYILLGSALNVFALVADFFDRKGATAISSLTVAAKGPNAAD